MPTSYETAESDSALDELRSVPVKKKATNDARREYAERLGLCALDPRHLWPKTPPSPLLTEPTSHVDYFSPQDDALLDADFWDGLEDAVRAKREADEHYAKLITETCIDRHGTEVAERYDHFETPKEARDAYESRLARGREDHFATALPADGRSDEIEGQSTYQDACDILRD